MKRARREPGQVEVRVKGKNLTITPALHDQVVNKMQRLDKYHDHLHSLEVELSCEKTRDASQHNRVEAHAVIYGHPIQVHTANADMYAAIDEAVDKLYRQLNRQKERLKAHNGHRPDVADMLEIEPEGEAEMMGAPEIVPERLAVKPQFEDEALADMVARGYDFYVFLNAQTERINVLYQRGEGEYGLIEPYVS